MALRSNRTSLFLERNAALLCACAHAFAQVFANGIAVFDRFGEMQLRPMARTLRVAHQVIAADVLAVAIEFAGIGLRVGLRCGRKWFFGGRNAD